MGVIIITGAASLLGAGIAGTLASSSAVLELTDLDMERAEAVASPLRKKTSVAVTKMDVTDRSMVNDVIGAIAERHGRIDALINCAGGMRGLGLIKQDFADTTSDTWARILDVNLHGVWNCCHAVLPYMMARGSGNIISLSAGRGLSGGPGAAVYAAAKAGVIVFSQSLAQEVGADGIRVNTIVPGNAEANWKNNEQKPRSPLGRNTTGEDIGKAVAFLLSARANHITGSCIDVSGGTALY